MRPVTSRSIRSVLQNRRSTRASWLRCRAVLTVLSRRPCSMNRDTRSWESPCSYMIMASLYRPKGLLCRRGYSRRAPSPDGSASRIMCSITKAGFTMVMQDFADSYLRGETRSPACCNQTVKFTDLLKTARDLGADCLATGHYVQRIDADGSAELHRGADPSKDQSYFLFATTPDSARLSSLSAWRDEQG